MQNYLNIANSSTMYILCIILVTCVLIQSIIFLIIGFKRGKAIGLSREKMMGTIRTSAIFSIVPSLPIIISLIAIAPILGLPFSWLRLSIVGSAPYELISAEIGAKSMGINGLGGDGYTPQVFANSMWIMSIGILWGLLCCVLFLKKYQNRMKHIQQKDSKWAAILINALFFGMLSVFIGPPFVQGGIALYVLLCSAVIMTLLIFISKNKRLGWLNNFALAISMVAGMTCAVMLSK